eukprot:gnl/TRDRNA2_/TRDRNA2_157565_c0_seq1.p1 gnl/TRDRNA2_/TRDRNA2_157565_c0~~gnl/TRDRNA2_/TRDRNA2_157565_c0_seq1.p1  ORF type:complete len:457 (-),score=91.07 gnl/TRDRNA2_/TRDRNA2_157565_c0_seq1:111-1481(-)
MCVGPQPATASAPPKSSYQKLRDIGEGSYGKVTLVNDTAGKIYAMKTVDVSKMSSAERNEAINEAKVLSMLKHPCIVSFRQSWLEDGSLSIVMDYLDGGDVQKRILSTKEASTTLPEHKILRWITEATLGLQYIHDKNVLHRDVKTQNLFLTKRDQLRIGDFGLCKVLRSPTALAKSITGTPEYFSPEMCLGSPYSFSSDIWALGCVLFRLAALKKPFEAPNLKELAHKIAHDPAPRIPLHYSTDLHILCNKIFQCDPQKRPSATEILQCPLMQNEIWRMLQEDLMRVEKKKAAAAAAEAYDKMRAAAASSRASHRRVQALRAALHDGGDSGTDTTQASSLIGRSVNIIFTENDSSSSACASRTTSPVTRTPHAVRGRQMRQALTRGPMATTQRPSSSSTTGGSLRRSDSLPALKSSGARNPYADMPADHRRMRMLVPGGPGNRHGTAQGTPGFEL